MSHHGEMRQGLIGKKTKGGQATFCRPFLKVKKQFTSCKTCTKNAYENVRLGAFQIKYVDSLLFPDCCELFTALRSIQKLVFRNSVGH